MINKVMDGEVAVVTINSKEKNELNGPFTQALRDVFQELREDDLVKSVVITGGNEKYFCTGLDLKWMSEQSYGDLISFLVNMTQLLKDTVLFPKPLIGAINGHTFGLGAIWAAGFDYRLVREDRGFICFPEMDINIPFLPGMIALCEHGLGRITFREMAYSAKRYSGPEAVELGYAKEALSKEKLLPKAIELARFMGQKAQPAFRLTKQRWAKHIAKIIDEEDEKALREQIPKP